MQPVDLLGITIKTLAEIEKEVSSQPGPEQIRRALFTSYPSLMENTFLVSPKSQRLDKVKL